MPVNLLPLFDKSYQRQDTFHSFAWLFKFTKNDQDCLLGIDRTRHLGKGSFSNVYEATLDVGSHQQSFAAKIYKEKRFYSLTEHLILSQHYRTFAPIETEEAIIVLMEKLPGKPLLNAWRLLPYEIAQLPLDQKFALIVSILSQAQQFYYRTPTNHIPFIHGDISPNNILYHICPVTNHITTHIIDFGLSQKLFKRHQLQRTRLRGTPYYMAPEILSYYHCDKSDVYSLTPIFLKILGATLPLKLKEAAQTTYSNQFFQAGYDFNGLMNFASLPLPRYFRRWITLFLKQMQNPEPQSRPDMDDCLRFFVSAYNVAVLYSSHPAHPTIYQHQAVMCLLAYNHWHQKASSYRYSKLQFSELPFAKCNRFCKALAQASEPIHHSLQQVQTLYDASHPPTYSQWLKHWFVKTFVPPTYEFLESEQSQTSPALVANNQPNTFG